MSERMWFTDRECDYIKESLGNMLPDLVTDLESEGGDSVCSHLNVKEARRLLAKIEKL